MKCQEDLMNQISPAILMLLIFARWDFEYVHVTIKEIVRSYCNCKINSIKKGRNCVNFT